MSAGGDAARGKGGQGAERPDRPRLPVAPPERRRAARPEPGDGPDLHIEEVEERHIPKDRNIFDK